MKFMLYTLVDVTETNARRGQGTKEVNQQANFDTMYNVIGLRTNPTDFEVSVINDSLDEYGFGSKFKGKHNIWKVYFYIEADESTSLEILQDDFDLVPIITNLDETAKLQNDVFVTKSNEKRNIIFERIDK
jgi:hypothetical protein